MLGGPAEQATEYIAPALVAGQDTIANHHDGGTDVVGNHPKRNVCLVAFAIVSVSDLTDFVGNIHYCIYVKEGADVLAYAG